MKKERKSPAQEELLFTIDPEPAKEILTSHGGIPLLVKAYRALGVGESVKRNVKIKERQRGFDEATMAESFVILNGCGGDYIEDFDHLREDEGLAELIGHQMPSSSAARKFLYEFHQEEKIEEAKQQRLPTEIAYVPEESEQLQGLGQVRGDIVKEFGRRRPNLTIATVDQDATIIESKKREALMTYEGTKGYQPMLCVWAETDLILVDEFRDGNVPAMMSPLVAARIAFNSLPQSVEEYYFRGDSACHESGLVNWLNDEEREGGPKGKIGFAISARMSAALRAAIINGVGEKEWRRYGDEDQETIQECADVVFVSNQEAKGKDGQPLRYVAIRFRKKQGELFADGSEVKYHAIVSNIWDRKADDLVVWQRQKAGTIEAINNIIKNELAGGVMPCGRFGANAAWLRLVVISHNVITAMKHLALPKELLKVRPKRLRFLIFNTAGRVLHHARKMILRLSTTSERLIIYWIEAMRLLESG